MPGFGLGLGISHKGSIGGGLPYLSDSLLVLDGATGALKAGGDPAAYLDPIPTWENQSTSASKASDATQATGSLQPILLTPGDDGPALHLPGVAGNYASVPDAADLDGFGDFSVEVTDLTMSDWTPAGHIALFAKWNPTGSNRAWLFQLTTGGLLRAVLSFDGTATVTYDSTGAVGLAAGSTSSVRLLRTGSTIRFYIDTGAGFTQLGTDVSGVSTTIRDSTAVAEVGGLNSGGSNAWEGKITRARVWNTATPDISTPVLDINFEVDATHGDSSFTATSGQTVTVNTSGDDPAAVIGFPTLRFDGVDDYSAGTWATNITGGRMFIVRKRLGAGGHANGVDFSTYETTGSAATGCIWSYAGSSTNTRTFQNPTLLQHAVTANQRSLKEVKIVEGAQSSKVNNADENTASASTALDAGNYRVANGDTGLVSNAMDLEFLAIYPGTMTDDEAAEVVSYLNDRFAIY